MPDIQAMRAVGFARAFSRHGVDISSLIAPPYDVLDEKPKQELLKRDGQNIVGIDLPFTPPKVVGPAEVYEQAGKQYRQWLAEGVLTRRDKAAVYVYQQTFVHGGKTFHRRGLIANVGVQEFGSSPSGGGVWPHEQVFASGKEDRLKLMQACEAQLSPIFGLYRDPKKDMAAKLEKMTSRPVNFKGTTGNDQVLHQVWEITEPTEIEALLSPLQRADIYIADGHHRYHTALNYWKTVSSQGGSQGGGTCGGVSGGGAKWCMFVLVAMEDPGMIVLATHRVLGGMKGFSWEKFEAAARPWVELKAFGGDDLEALEAALPGAGIHAMGLYVPGNAAGKRCWIATTKQADPLENICGNRAAAWRQLDVAIVQHLMVEKICQPAFCEAGQAPAWKFPHELSVLKKLCEEGVGQLGMIVQPTPLQAVMDVSQAGELMPQKSTFFYPKLATGLVMNPLA